MPSPYRSAARCSLVVIISASVYVTLVGVVVALLMGREHVLVARRVSGCVTKGVFKVFKVFIPAEYMLTCTEEVPTCGDTCNKVSTL